jgi:cardiolipin synthase
MALSRSSLRYLPNIITLARILLVLPITLLLLRQHYAAALQLFFVAAVSDGLDGLLAKRFGWTSRLGGLLDPLADKMLLVSSLLVLGAQGLLPLWLVVLALGRDVLIVLGVVAYQWWIAPIQPAPSLISKANTLLQILVIIGVLIQAAGWLHLEAWLVLLYILTAAATLGSGADYARQGYLGWQTQRRKSPAE